MADLGIVKAESLHNGGLGLGLTALAAPDGGDDLVHDVDGPFEALQDVGTLPGPFQVEPGPAGDDLALELQVVLDTLLQGEDFGLVVDQGQHDHAHGGL